MRALNVSNKVSLDCPHVVPARALRICKRLDAFAAIVAIDVGREGEMGV